MMIEQIHDLLQPVHENWVFSMFTDLMWKDTELFNCVKVAFTKAIINNG